MALRNTPILFLARKLWKYSAGNRKRVVLFFVLFLCANGVGILEPFVVAYLLDVIQKSGVNAGNIRTIVLLLSSLIGLQVAFWAFHGPARVLEITNAFLVRANYKMFLLKGTLNLPSAWHTDHHSGNTIDKIEKGSQALYHFSTRTFEVIESVIKLVSSFVVLTYFDFHAGIIVTVMVVLTLVIILQFDKRLIAQYEHINRADNTISAKVFDTISNVTTVIILRIETLVAKAIEKKIHQPFALFVRNNKMNEFKWFSVSFTGALMVFFVLCSYFFGALSAGTVVTIGTVYVLYSYVQRVMDVFFRFAYQYGDIVQQKTSILNAESLAKDFRSITFIAKNRAVEAWKTIAIQDVMFSYQIDAGHRAHLDHVSMKMKRGERIALIGESGSGKTTFLKILRGLYTPKKSTIVLNGKKLPRGFEALSSEIALIPQEPEIFSTTIRENITMGIDHKMSTIKLFTDMACFTHVAERLPHQWDSSIVEKGVNLSGGEKQRLALARGLLACADKSIVLLDEPTSSMDMQNEMTIYENIFAAFPKKTIISSVHRLHLLPKFDTIYVFDQGKVIASGSFDHLLRSSERFQRLWEKYRTDVQE